MATAQKPSAQTLFNDPVLSDVKIKQTYDGRTREYHGHKAIPCFQSVYFMRAFTGSFNEASEATMELHDDDPDHFECVLKFMVTLQYDPNVMKSTAAKDQKHEVVQYILGVYRVADKYDVGRLLTPAAEHLQSPSTRSRTALCLSPWSRNTMDLALSLVMLPAA
ncbi:hypothetical protein CC86DRAFT_410338 [Ophiobolus disseminans]|uniref:BTB domain-containing protein n=1 Tax=Ophiobolus disseminans TaxID=1469910 RepID=A0A6A6ZME0_9PLEO|nr:hypothetical protein CC86DRAFT_410338 [Ophiobolus disseminans]